jgi:hypothetical protein
LSGSMVPRPAQPLECFLRTNMGVIMRPMMPEKTSSARRGRW